MSEILAKPSSYIDYLPAIYREGETKANANFVGRFLKIFEKLLSGIDDGVKPDYVKKIKGIEEIIEIIHDYFDPLFTPPNSDDEKKVLNFISYLSSWVGLVMNQNWPDNNKRRILKKIVPLYKKRGTKEGLNEYLRVFVGPNVKIDESLVGLQIGEHSSVGIDTIIGGAPPFFFFVRITLSEMDLVPDIVNPIFFSNLVKLTKQIIDNEKPAYTYYSIRYDVPGIIVGVLSHIGIDTLLGSRAIPRFIF